MKDGLKSLGIILFIGLSICLVASGSRVRGQPIYPPIVRGNVWGDFGENGITSFSFNCGFPSDWYTSLPVRVESTLNFYDQSNITIYYRLAIVIDFVNTDRNLSYQKILFTYKNAGYGCFDQYLKKTWNLPAKTTGIPLGASWVGYVFLNGSVSFGNKTYHAPSNYYQVTYSSLPLFEIMIVGLFSMIFIMIIIRYKRRQ